MLAQCAHFKPLLTRFSAEIGISQNAFLEANHFATCLATTSAPSELIVHSQTIAALKPS